MGIPWAEARLVGELMGLKTILNEFVAYLALAQQMEGNAALSTRSFIIATYALCGFANFGSVAIMIGGIGGIAPERRGDLARLGCAAGGRYARDHGDWLRDWAIPVKLSGTSGVIYYL